MLAVRFFKLEIMLDKCKEEKKECVYDANITHNLNKMAHKTKTYYALWRPEKIGKSKAKDIIQLLEKGLTDLKLRPEYFKKFNSSNGWGMYENFVEFVKNYLEACKKYPETIIEISR